MPSFADRYWISIAISVGDEHDPQQQIAELRAALDVRGEVARVDVGDRRHERRAEHRQRRLQPAFCEQRVQVAGAERDLAADTGGPGAFERRLDPQRWWRWRWRRWAHRVDRNPHRARQLAPDRLLALAVGKAHQQRAAERLALDHLTRSPGEMPCSDR